MDTLAFQPELRRSHLVQRLNKPQNFTIAGQRMDNPFAFGGGLANGGISKEGMTALRDLFSFDYMGASEFEWGIVPSSLSFIAKNNADMETGIVQVNADGPTVYYICHKAHAQQLPERIKLFATKPPEAKELVGLDAHFKNDKWSMCGRDVVGWLDCSNGFMFFVDKEMYLKTCELFGVNRFKKGE